MAHIISIDRQGDAGYLVNTKTSARVYNLFHHKGVAVVIGTIGLPGGIASFGLKYNNDFKLTHLHLQ